MARSHTLILVPALVASLFVGACKDDGIAGLRTPGITFAAGESQTDTIGAALVQALVVEVRDAGGRLAPNAIVRFAPGPETAGPPFNQPLVSVSRLDASSFGFLVVDTTDDRGRASVMVRLGTKAGPARVVATVPELGLTNSATYTVVAGAAASVVALPKDTVLSIGGTATLRSAVADRYGNPRADPVTISRVSGGVTLQGNVVTAQSGGIAKIVVQAMGASDTTTIAVVPSGVLAVAIGQAGIATLNLDGSGYRVLTPTPSQYVRWAPDGSAITFDNSLTVPARVVTMTGAVRPIRPSSAGAEAEMYPAFSPDGAWVYVSVIAQGTFRLWRARFDGTEAAEVTISRPEDDMYPSPSPDGLRLVYVRRTGSAQDYLRTLDLSTGVVSAIDIPGHAPAWSPLGDLIAYVDLRAGSVLKVMRPDGTGQRQVSTGGGYGKSVQWSPDGKWLVSYNESAARIHLIDVATGVAMPLSYSASMRSPSWKP